MILGAVGLGLIVGSCGSLLTQLSSSSSLKKSLPLVFRSLRLGVQYGDHMALPVINQVIPYKWGERVLLNLPSGLPSQKVIEQANAISEALQRDVELTFENGLVIDVFDKKMTENAPFSVEKRNDIKVPVGVNRRGEVRYYDFAGSFPHFLIGGISGGGKSVFLRGLLTSLAVGPQPDLYLCDMKGGVELGLFADLICTKRFAVTLKQVAELVADVEKQMNERYAIMAANGSQEWHGKRIALVMDELADLKTRQGDPENPTKTAIKTKLTTISAKGRAAGVILVLATQRPSADVVDGLIKTNIATSLCFRTRDAVQSRIVLDHERAAHLDEIPGRCIFQQSKDETLQTFYLSYEKAKKILANVERKGKNDEPGASENLPVDRNSLQLG